MEDIQQDEVMGSSNEEPLASRVAFSVALTKSIGPTEEEKVLKFEEVVTNIGWCFKKRNIFVNCNMILSPMQITTGAL